MKKLLLILCLFFAIYQATAQDQKELSREFSVQYNRSFFLDRYYTYYHPSNGISFQYSNRIKEFNELGDKIHLSWGLNLGYNYARTKQEIFYAADIFQTTNDNTWVKFSDLQILTLSFQMKYSFLLTNKLKIHAAAEAGYAFIKYSSEGLWNNTEVIMNEMNKVMLGSKFDLSYDITDKIGLNVGFQYNLFIANTSQSIFFQRRLDPQRSINHSYATSAGAYFKF
jgi:hypothetical protein